MLRIHQLIGAGAMLTLAMLQTQGAWAVDLTGIWTGEQQCDRFNGKKFSTPFKDDIMVISQHGSDVNMAALFTEGTFNLLFQGHVIDDAKDGGRKGQATFTACPTAPGSDYQEMLRATKAELKGKGNEDGEFEGDSIFLQIDDVDVPTDTGTCRWKYKRVDTGDVGVPACDEVGVSGLMQSPAGPKRP